MPTEPVNNLAKTDRALSIALLRTREAVMERFRPMLQTHGVTEQQWRIMRVLREIGPCSATELAERACILPPSLSRILRNMEAKGFAATMRDDADARKTRVILTEAGDAFLRALTPQSNQAYAQIEAKIGAERLNSLVDELNYVLGQLDQ